MGEAAAVPPFATGLTKDHRRRLLRRRTKLRISCIALRSKGGSRRSTPGDAGREEGAAVAN